jgi:2'-5' RNA ligase
MSMNEAADSALGSFYDGLWREAEDGFTRQKLRLDPHLLNKEADRRRGLSLIIRPAGEVVQAVDALVGELRQSEPHQYFYAAEEYHVTLLSPQTATENYLSSPELIEGYERAVARAGAGFGPFQIQFRGITGTAEAVMIQGFPKDDALNRLRSRIREEMVTEQVPIQQRYPPRAAHVTIMRYVHPPEDFPGWAEKLRSVRRRNFGAGQVAQIHLVENDWYMSARKLKPIRTFDLESGGI